MKAGVKTVLARAVHSHEHQLMGYTLRIAEGSVGVLITHGERVCVCVSHGHNKQGNLKLCKSKQIFSKLKQMLLHTETSSVHLSNFVWEYALLKHKTF